MSAATTALSSSYRLEKLHLNSSTRNNSYSCVRCASSSSVSSWIPTAKHGYRNSMTPSLLYLSPIKPRARRNHTSRTMMNALNNGLPPQVPVPSGSPFPQWSRWLLLTVLPMVLPFFKSKWGPLIMIKRQLDTTFATVETMSEVIEQVAIKVDKIADEMVESLPEGSKLRKAIEILDDMAEETVKAADCVQDLLHKVEDLEDKVEKKAIVEQSDKAKTA